MKLYLILTFLLILFSYSSFSQFDSTKVFKKLKGTLSKPLSNFKIDTPNHENPCDCMIFICDSAYSVHAIYDGVVVTVKKIEDMFVVITKFGNYFITYSGLANPVISEGSFIKTGQTISSLEKTYDHYELTLYISNRDKNFNPSEWLVP